MKIRVLNISPTVYHQNSVIGGGEKYIHYLNKALVTGFKEKFIQYSVSEAYASESVLRNDKRINNTKFINPPRNEFEIFDLQSYRELIVNEDLIIVHQCLGAFGMAAAAAAKMAGKTVIGFDHGGGEVAGILSEPDAAFFFDCFISYSRFGATGFQGFYNKNFSILGPVDTDFYVPSTATTRDKNTVLSVGRILPHKGFESVIRALPSEKQYRIIGTVLDHAYYQYLSDLSHNVKAPVQFLFGLSDSQVQMEMNLCGVYVQPTLNVDYRGDQYAKPELLGLSALEALATGSPALVSDTGALSELSQIDGCTVYKNLEELSACLNATSGFTSQYTQEEIHESVKLKYGHEQFGIKLVDFIMNLMGSNL